MKRRKASKPMEELTLPEEVKERYGFTYSLSYEEAYEAFFSLAQKRSRRFTLLTCAGLSIIALVLLVFFALDNTKVHYFFLAILTVLLLFYVVYVPTLKARRGAKQVARTGGTYQVEITDVGDIRLPNNTVLELAGDKDARVVETDNLFVLRPNTRTTLCIPKRVMKEDEIFGVREILKLYVKVNNVNV